MPSMRSLGVTLLEISCLQAKRHIHTYIRTHTRHHHRINSLPAVGKNLKPKSFNSLKRDQTFSTHFDRQKFCVQYPPGNQSPLSIVRVASPHMSENSSFRLANLGAMHPWNNLLKDQTTILFLSPVSYVTC